MRGLRKLTLDKRNKTLHEVVRNKKATDTTQVMELIEKGDTLLTRYTCKGSDGTKFFVFAKEVEPKEADILNHEKKVYNICNHLVQMGVCPFRVQGYDVANAPKNIMYTESFDPNECMTLYEFINARSNRLSQYEATTLLIQLLYALETNYRVGLRHNDLHLDNVLVRLTNPTRIKIRYVARDATTDETTVLENCTFQVLIFDFDRAMKFPRNLKHPSLQKKLNSTPIMMRHNYFYRNDINTERYDVYKVLMHLRKSSPFMARFMQRLDMPAPVELAPNERINEYLLFKRWNANEENFGEPYHYLNPSLRSAEQYLMALLSWCRQTRQQKASNNRLTITADISILSRPPVQNRARKSIRSSSKNVPKSSPKNSSPKGKGVHSKSPKIAPTRPQSGTTNKRIGPSLWGTRLKIRRT